jgi:hypothetical protein
MMEEERNQIVLNTISKESIYTRQEEEDNGGVE